MLGLLRRDKSGKPIILTGVSINGCALKFTDVMDTPTDWPGVQNKDLVLKPLKLGKGRPPLPKSIRPYVLSRDNHHCRFCGRSPEQTGTIPHIHHLKAFAIHGHSKDPNEYVCACPDCNHAAETGNLTIIPLDTPRWKRIIEGADKEPEQSNPWLQGLRTKEGVDEKVVRLIRRPVVNNIVEEARDDPL